MNETLSGGQLLAVVFILLCFVFSLGVYVGARSAEVPCYDEVP